MTDRAHLFTALLAGGMVLFIVRLVRLRQLRAKYAMLWISVGAGLVVLAAFPDLLDRLADRLGVFYPPAVLLLGAVAFLLAVVIHFSWELSRLEERSRLLAEDVAILRARLEELERDGGGHDGSPD